jgi:hypothetical protein
MVVESTIIIERQHEPVGADTRAAQGGMMAGTIRERLNEVEKSLERLRAYHMELSRRIEERKRLIPEEIITLRADIARHNAMLLELIRCAGVKLKYRRIEEMRDETEDG